MANRQGRIQKIAAPLRVLAQRFTFLLLFASAVVVVLFGKANPSVFEGTRVVIMDTVAPILNVLSQPVSAFEVFVGEIRQLTALRVQNRELRQENARLEVWKSASQKLEAENSRLRDLLHFVPHFPARYVAARVVADASGAFVRSLIVNAGSRDGIEQGQAAVVGGNLIGRVAEVGKSSSRILLISDLNSRIPALVARSRVRAVLAGDNSPTQRLLYLPKNAQVVVGDVIVTSGHGGIFPVGLKIGAISSVGKTHVRVRPFTEWRLVEEVLLIDYGSVRPAASSEEVGEFRDVVMGNKTIEAP